MAAVFSTSPLCALFVVILPVAISTLSLCVFRPLPARSEIRPSSRTASPPFACSGVHEYGCGTKTGDAPLWPAVNVFLREGILITRQLQVLNACPVLSTTCARSFTGQLADQDKVHTCKENTAVGDRP